MKNTLFTGIIGENPAVLLNREQTPGIGMPLLNKDVARNIVVVPAPSFAVTGLLLEVTSQSEKINTRDNTVSKKSAL